MKNQENSRKHLVVAAAIAAVLGLALVGCQPRSQESTYVSGGRTASSVSISASASASTSTNASKSASASGSASTSESESASKSASASASASSSKSTSAAKSAEASTSAASGTTWTASWDCVTCHPDQVNSMDDTACLASTHAAKDLTCTSCHTDEAGLVEAHNDGDGASVERAKKYATKLRKTEIDPTICEACHGTYDDLAKATADVKVCTDANGTTVNPHEAAALNADHEAAFTCDKCHSMHSDQTAAELAPSYCRTCHHQNVYQCHICHD